MDSVTVRKPKRNLFDLSHEKPLSFKMGYLVPILCEEVLPGDKWRLSTELLLRFAPMLAPVMHRVDCRTEFFFVPNRLVYDDWREFITGGEDGQQVPPFPLTNFNNNVSFANNHVIDGSLADYLGIATHPRGSYQSNATFAPVSELPARGYQLIYNEYYRNQNVDEPVPINTTGIPASTNQQLIDLWSLRRRRWKKDYFTSALPWTQRGAPVTIPVGGMAPVVYDNPNDSRPAFVNPDGTILSNSVPAAVQAQASGTNGPKGTLGVIDGTNTQSAGLDPRGTLWTDLSEATSISINDFRDAIALQQYLEISARGGSRYIEFIRSHFGVRSSDARLQRPEYLGGGISPVHFSEVLQTSSTDSESPQANMAGHGYSHVRSHEFTRFFEEHGYVIGIVSVMPRTSYGQGTRRHFFKKDKFDWYWPVLSHLGEQAIYNAELFDQPWFAEEHRFAEFGYHPRYSEYRTIYNTFHGDFKNSLDFWHMGRIFDGLENEEEYPGLNSEFVASYPTSRIFAVTDRSLDTMWCYCAHSIKALRPISKFGSPGLFRL